MKTLILPQGFAFRALCLTAAALLFAPEAPAQELVMKDGRTIPAPGATRRGDQIFVRVNMSGGAGQIAYAVNQIETVKLPESPDFNAARKLLAEDKPSEALAPLSRVVRESEPFRGLGDDRWGRAQLLRSTALFETGKDEDARGVLREVIAHGRGTDAEKVATVQLAAFSPPDASKNDEWLRRAEAAISNENASGVRSAGHLLKARVELEQEEYEKALRDALAVTIYFSDQRLEVSRAQLIAAEAYLNLRDKRRAVRSYHEVITSFPGTASAELAQKELSKGGEAFAVIVKALEAEQSAAKDTNEAETEEQNTENPQENENPQETENPQESEAGSQE